MNSKIKPVIYQLFPRWYTNCENANIFNGTIQQNGVGKLNDINTTVLGKIKELGVTHVWYTGVIEHSNKTDYTKYGIASSNHHIVKGNAGSPYAIRDYYDIDPDIAEDVSQRMLEFEALVRRTHEAELKVIIDFVPNHVARDYHSDVKPDNVKDLGEDDNKNMFFSPSNNFFYITGEKFAPSIDLGDYVEYPAKATGNDCFNSHPGANDWYETVKLNYGVDPWNGTKHFSPIPSTWNKMLEILKYWTSKGVDGFRCDMAHMVPVEFWNWAIEQVKAINPNVIFIAEIYDVNLYCSYLFDGKFDYLYDKVNLYDTLCGIVKHNRPASAITQCWQTVDDIKDRMLNFLENHDEPRMASPQMFGSIEKGVPAFVVSATLTKCPFMLYAGQEMGEKAEGATGFSGDDGRTSIFDYICVPTVNRFYAGGKFNIMRINNEERRLRALYKKVLTLCNSNKAISQGELFDLMYVNGGNLDVNSHYVYLRHFGEQTVMIGANFDDKDANIEVVVPEHAFSYLGIKEGCVFMKELLSKKTRHQLLKSNEKVWLDIPANSAVIWCWEENME